MLSNCRLRDGKLRDGKLRDDRLCSADAIDAVFHLCVEHLQLLQGDLAIVIGVDPLE
jgi:hypothetical protein